MKDRIEVLRGLLAEGKLSTQDELRVKLEKARFRVTQSTISRDLRKLGAVRAIDHEGSTVYRLPDPSEMVSASVSPEIVRNVQANDNLVVIHTVPGGAHMVARHLDLRRSTSIFLGTIAGDDTVFVALSAKTSAAEGLRVVRELLDQMV
jgi:transcriptional regulator of arginine metabolism